MTGISDVILLRRLSITLGIGMDGERAAPVPRISGSGALRSAVVRRVEGSAIGFGGVPDGSTCLLIEGAVCPAGLGPLARLRERPATYRKDVQDTERMLGMVRREPHHLKLVFLVKLGKQPFHVKLAKPTKGAKHGNQSLER